MEEFMRQQKIAEEIVKATEEAVNKIKEKQGLSENLKKFEQQEKLKMQKEKYQKELDQKIRDEVIKQRNQDHVKKFGEGRIFITMKEQKIFNEALKAKEIHNQRKPL